MPCPTSCPAHRFPGCGPALGHEAIILPSARPPAADGETNTRVRHAIKAGSVRAILLTVSHDGATRGADKVVDLSADLGEDALPLVNETGSQQGTQQ